MPHDAAGAQPEPESGPDDGVDYDDPAVWRVPRPEIPDCRDENGQIDTRRLHEFYWHIEAQRNAVLGIQARIEGAAAAGDDPDVMLPKLYKEFVRIRDAKPGELPMPNYDDPRGRFRKP